MFIFNLTEKGLSSVSTDSNEIVSRGGIIPASKTIGFAMGNGHMKVGGGYIRPLRIILTYQQDMSLVDQAE